MEQVISAAVERLRRGEAVVLCRIAAASGSTPRGPGAVMAVFGNGEFTGTIGGGAVEYHTLEQAREALAAGKSALQAFTLAPNDIRDIGMVCGGNVTVLIQYLAPEDLPLAESLLEALTKGRPLWVVTSLLPDGTWSMTLRETPLAPGLTEEDGVRRWVEAVPPRHRVLLFGGGHVGAALVPLLAAVDFQVTVYDDRPHAARPERFPAARAVMLGEYDEILRHLSVTQEDYVVIMTPGHQGDFTVLSQILTTPAAYIGCIGSRRKVAAAREKLLAAGFTEEDLARVHSPIGLAIGAETPEEIAVSIAGEMIAHRAAGRAARHE